MQRSLMNFTIHLVPNSVGNKHITGVLGGVKTDGEERRTDQRQLTLKIRDIASP